MVIRICYWKAPTRQDIYIHIALNTQESHQRQQRGGSAVPLEQFGALIFAPGLFSSHGGHGRWKTRRSHIPLIPVRIYNLQAALENSSLALQSLVILSTVSWRTLKQNSSLFPFTLHHAASCFTVEIMWSYRTHAWRYESESCTFDLIKKSVVLWLEIFMLENNGTMHPWWTMKKLYEEVGSRFFNSADIAALFLCIALTWERTANTVAAQKQNN